MVVKPIFYLLGGVLTIVLGVAMIATIFAFFSVTPYVSYFSGGNMFFTGLTWFSGITAIFLLLLLALFFIIRMFTDYRLKPYLKRSMWATIFLCIIFFIGSFLFHLPNYSSNGSIKESATYTISDNVIRINESESDYLDDGHTISLGNVVANRNGLFGDNIVVNLYKSDEAQVRIEKEISASGNSRSEAKKIAGNTSISENIIGNIISIPEVYRVPKGNKYRGQRVTYSIYIPRNKEVEIDKNMYWTIWKNEFKKEKNKK